jgi:hypothetical protein
LLDVCNGVALEFGQPLLYFYNDSQEQKKGGGADQFHISIAWSLRPPKSHEDHDVKLYGHEQVELSTGISYSLLSQLSSVSIHFSEVKVRIGQDVHSIALKTRRQSSA